MDVMKEGGSAGKEGKKKSNSTSRQRLQEELRVTKFSSEQVG